MNRAQLGPLLIVAMVGPLPCQVDFHPLPSEALVINSCRE
jgi:hypothetical protein